jgi:hypothetical protein
MCVAVACDGTNEHALTPASLAVGAARVQWADARAAAKAKAAAARKRAANQRKPVPSIAEACSDVEGEPAALSVWRGVLLGDGVWRCLFQCVRCVARTKYSPATAQASADTDARKRSRISARADRGAAAPVSVGAGAGGAADRASPVRATPLDAAVVLVAPAAAAASAASSSPDSEERARRAQAKRRQQHRAGTDGGLERRQRVRRAPSKPGGE